MSDTTTKRLYYESNALKLAATVTNKGHDDHGNWVALNQTIAHVKGGGAKADRGTIGTVPFHDVASPTGRFGEVRHYLEREADFVVGETVEIVVDEAWRNTQAAYHNGGHLIAALIEESYPQLKGVAGHHYAGEARVEFTGDSFPDPDEVRRKLNNALVEAIRNDLPVRIVGDPYLNRLIQIANYPPVPCGGVHPPTTASLGRVEAKSVKVKGGKLRVSYEVFPR